MKGKILAIALTALLLAPLATAQETVVTPKLIAESYGALADTILALRRAEASFVASLLDGHFHAAKQRMKNEQWRMTAAEMALFANEGDNAIGGVRKRLLKGGHHFNAEGEEKGLFEPGFVVVTKTAKQQMLAASSEMRQAATEEARKAAWKKFATIARELLGKGPDE